MKKADQSCSSKTSKVWLYFHRPIDGEAKCKLCVNKSYKTGGGTSNLRNHLRNKHPSEYDIVMGKGNVGNSRPILNTATSSLKTAAIRSMEKLFPYSADSGKRKRIDALLALMIARDYQPFSIVENAGFIDFVKELNPRYKMIDRKKLSSKLLPKLFGIAVKELHDMLENADYVAITCDGWTSQNNDSYLGVTCHFLREDAGAGSFVLESAALDTVPILKDEKAESLARILPSIFKEWNIKDKVCCLVTDNAAVMKKTAKLLNVTHIPCFAHSLNLIIKHAVLCKDNFDLKTSASTFEVLNEDNEDNEYDETELNCDDINVKDDITRLIAICKRTVQFFHSSPKATRMLRELREKTKKDDGKVTHGLIQQVGRYNLYSLLIFSLRLHLLCYVIRCVILIYTMCCSLKSDGIRYYICWKA